MTLVLASLVLAARIAAAAPAPPGASGAAGPSEVDTSKSMLNPGGFTSAEICAGCHKAIHGAWQESVHARSFTDPVFSASLAGAAARKGTEATRLCLGCHAPTTLVTGDLEAKQDLTREGITCSFCHSITAAGPEWKPKVFSLEPGQTVRGPFQFASSPGHGTVYSPLHRTALLCAACHQYRSSAGVAVLNTYEEWRAGPYPAQGVQCQDCHMALVRGAAAETIPTPALEAAQDTRLINLHRLVGGSSLGQLRRALSAKVRETKRSEGTIRAVVEVRNDAAGHKAPTGLPTRSIVLRLEASREGKPFHTDERVYRRMIYDRDGKKILTDAEAFLDTARVGADSRLAPGETRTEIFTFPAPPGEAKLVIGLDYVVVRTAGSPPQRERFQELTVDVR